ncbi:ATP-binding cassette domain-containing protein, partial [Bradyrhizobium sp.]|uniref:ATP-binding cassette domain-containing protein n=1 Tax=Bradyrhizobium sp. TaxID=376 RepID=UPI003919CBE0
LAAHQHRRDAGGDLHHRECHDEGGNADHRQAEGIDGAEQRAQGQVEQLQIRPADVEIDLGLLSGGNQQKVALAKWLSHPPRLLVLCEPTRGMDVGAKSDVIGIVRQLRDQGIAVIVLSTEPETVLSLADRVIVLKRGEVVREFAGETISKDRLLEAA